MGFCRIYFRGLYIHGGIAQLVERLVRNEKARGSNPLTSSVVLGGFFSKNQGLSPIDGDSARNTLPASNAGLLRTPILAHWGQSFPELWRANDEKE
jgi:hypothetical protein